MITPDLIPDEADEWLAASDAHDLDRIFLVAPSSTPERLAATVEASRGFVYAASTMGVTGARDAVSTAAPELVRRVKAVSDIPVGVGLGVRSREQAAQIGAYADGVIVGSALVSALKDGVAGGAVADRGTRRRCAAEDYCVTTTVLAYIPSPPQGVWHLGPVPIRAYALFIIVGIVVALLIGDRRWVARGGERGVIYDIAMWAVPFGLIGGRLYHVITDWRTYFGDDGAGLGGGAADLGRRPRHLGRGRARRRRRVDRVPADAAFRCPRSVTRSRRESCWRRPSAGWATTSTRSCTAGRRRCRGAWRSTSGATPSGALDSLNGVSTGQLDRGRPSDVPVRIAVERPGFRGR